MSIVKRSRPKASGSFSNCQRVAVLGLLAMAPVTSVSAELAVSQLIVELKPLASRAADVEIYNDSAERAFVSVEPREIINAGRDGEKPLLTPDPEKLGLLVSPTRLVIEPRQRRRLRIATIGPVPNFERVYRVTVKPVAGEVSGSTSGLKLLVGYDLLVLVRPSASNFKIEVGRSGASLSIVNRGNESVELAEGKQCESDGVTCHKLSGKRLYAGATWQQSLLLSTPGEYRVRSTAGWSTVKF